MNLDDRLYTSTEVAEILGVSLRSVYRYLEEGKLIAEVKTATGRLRFTKQNIMDFLHPQEGSQLTKLVEDKKEVSAPAVPAKSTEPTESKEEPISAEAPKVKESPSQKKEEEEVDWLERFRSSAAKFSSEEVKKDDVEEPQPTPVEVKKAVKEEPVVPEPVVEEVPVAAKETVSGLASSPAPVETVEEEEPAQNLYYYRSLVGGLKEIAQNIDKVARKAGVDYAFTLNAGASLHKPLKAPFSLLHVYIHPKDREFFEKMLQLVGSNEASAQLCLMIAENSAPFDSREELHGLYVVSKSQLKQDAVEAEAVDLLSELA